VQLASDLPHRQYGVLHPFTEFLTTHPYFTDNACNEENRTDLTIQAEELWDRNDKRYAERNCRTTLGGDAFYAYKQPVNFAANVGFLIPNTVMVFFVTDADDNSYFMLIIDEADDNLVKWDGTPDAMDSVEDGFCHYIRNADGDLTDAEGNLVSEPVLVPGYTYGEACNDDGGSAILVIDSPTASADPYSRTFTYTDSQTIEDQLFEITENRWTASRWEEQDFTDFVFDWSQEASVEALLDGNLEIVVQDDANDFDNAKQLQGQWMTDELIKKVGNGITNWVFSPGKSDGLAIGYLPAEYCWNFDIHSARAASRRACTHRSRAAPATPCRSCNNRRSGHHCAHVHANHALSVLCALLAPLAARRRARPRLLRARRLPGQPGRHLPHRGHLTRRVGHQDLRADVRRLLLAVHDVRRLRQRLGQRVRVVRRQLRAAGGHLGMHRRDPAERPLHRLRGPHRCRFVPCRARVRLVLSHGQVHLGQRRPDVVHGLGLRVRGGQRVVRAVLQRGALGHAQVLPRRHRRWLQRRRCEDSGCDLLVQRAGHVRLERHLHVQLRLGLLPRPLGRDRLGCVRHVRNVL